MGHRVKKALMGMAALAALALGGSALAQAGSSGESDQAEPGEASELAKGPAADRAEAAALRSTKGGTANAVERDSENGATWEVEVTKTDGSTVDVRLDERYDLVVVEDDSEAKDDSR